MDVDFTTPLNGFVDDLNTAGMRASADPAALNLPGVLVTVRSLTFERLTGYTLNLELFLVVPDNGVLRAMRDLEVRLKEVFDAGVRPNVDGEVRSAGVQLPTAPGVKPPPPLPALAFNFDINV